MAVLSLTPTTEAALEDAARCVHQARQADPLQPVYFLLPNAATLHQVRWRFGSSLGIHLLQFYALGHHVLDAAGSPVHELPDTAIRRLVHHLLTEMRAADELSSCAQVWNKPGFQQVVVEWLREMKAQGISPEDAAAHAEVGARHVVPLHLLYARYQNFLQTNAASDADGLLWLAAEALEAQPHLLGHASPFIVLGFDQFNPIQLRILRHLSTRVADLRLYLLWDPQRRDDSLVLSRLRPTRAAVEKQLDPAIELLGEAELAIPHALIHLRRTLLEPNAATADDGDPPAVRAVAAPSREAEVRWGLRSIKRHLLDGVRPDCIALLAPQVETYRRLVHTVADEYAVPVQCERPLVENPAVAAMLRTMTLSPDFPWRRTFEVLRSPYIEQTWLTDQQIDHLDQLTRERPVVRGRDQWRHALEPLPPAPDAGDDVDDDLGPAPLAAQLDPTVLAAIEEGLMAFFDHVTPPRQATYREYAHWLEQRILGLAAQDVEAFDPDAAGSDRAANAPSAPDAASLDLLAASQVGTYAERDGRALSHVRRGLHSLIQAADLIPGAEDGAVPWAVYHADLNRVLAAISLRADPTRAAVTFSSLEAARAVVVDHLFVLGLSEGEFPHPPTPDVFYAPEERRDHPLPLQRVDPAEDASLWWQVIGSATQTLTLLRPRLDDSGAPWPPSPYWDAVVDAIQGLRDRVAEPPIAAQPDSDAACSPGELLVALAAAGAQTVPAEISDAWGAARAAQRTLAARQAMGPPGEYEGVLSASELAAELAQRYGPDRAWSASRLNRYGRCPYGFFAEHVLRLEPRPDPEEGLDALQRGRLMHAVLARLQRRLAAASLALTTANRDTALARLDACCDELFPGAPSRYGFRPTPLWDHRQAELRRQLRAFVAWECEQNGETADFQPLHQELRFGVRGAELPALPLTTTSGVAFRLYGVIDRVDRSADGRLRVVDYKTGGSLFYDSDIERGLAFQSSLYALAAERLLTDGKVAKACYLHIPNQKSSGQVACDPDASHDAGVQAAVDLAGEFVERVRRGWFPSAPAKPAYGSGACAHYCQLTGICRVSRQTIAKAQRWS